MAFKTESYSKFKHNSNNNQLQHQQQQWQRQQKKILQAHTAIPRFFSLFVIRIATIKEAKNTSEGEKEELINKHNNNNHHHHHNQIQLRYGKRNVYMYVAKKEPKNKQINSLFTANYTPICNHSINFTIIRYVIFLFIVSFALFSVSVSISCLSSPLYGCFIIIIIVPL